MSRKKILDYEREPVRRAKRLARQRRRNADVAASEAYSRGCWALAFAYTADANREDLKGK